MKVAHVLLAQQKEPSAGVARFLRSLGCEVTRVWNALEAIEEIQRGTYDCIVIDFDLPGDDGLAVTLFLSRQRPELLERTIVICSEGDAGASAPNGVALVRDRLDLPVLGECVARIVGDAGDRSE
jgi:CheY-like chemotaxis protein